MTPDDEQGTGTDGDLGAPDPAGGLAESTPGSAGAGPDPGTASAGAEPDPEVAEPDPEADLPDPEQELPSVPEPPDVPSTTDAPPELLRAFWTTVVVLNVALLSISVGAMMVAFDVHRTLGAGILVVGVVSLARGVLKYRALDDREWSDGPD